MLETFDLYVSNILQMRLEAFLAGDGKMKSNQFANINNMDAFVLLECKEWRLPELCAFYFSPTFIRHGFRTNHRTKAVQITE